MSSVGTIVCAYLSHLEEPRHEELGVEEGQPWLITDATKRIAYLVKFRNIHRFDVMLRLIP